MFGYWYKIFLIGSNYGGIKVIGEIGFASFKWVWSLIIVVVFSFALFLLINFDSLIQTIFFFIKKLLL